MGDRFKNSETLLGIETEATEIKNCWHTSFKNSETLLGIETGHSINSICASKASKTLKPF